MAALAFAVCGSASAQSSVTVYGTVDLFLHSAKSGPTRVTRMDDGGNAASRLGFRGSEDLGGGLRANFVLEAGLAGDTGAGTIPGPGLAFTRQASVGLSGPWGSVEMGRMYTPMFYALFRADPFSLNTVYAPLSLVTAIDAQSGLTPFAARANNMLRYRTPAAQPFVLDIAVAPGESSGASKSSGNLYGGTIGWNGKPFYIGYGLQKTRSGSAAAPVANPTTSTYQSLDASVAVTPTLRLSANYIRNSLDLSTTPTAEFANFGVEWNATATSRVLAGVTKRKVDGTSRGQMLWTLGYDHFLSKRTVAYARWLSLDNRSNASVSFAGVPVVLNSGDGVRSIGVGIRHHF